MQFTPAQIENRDFAPQLKGYDEAEVRDFLRMLAADYRELVEGGRPRLTADDIEGRRFGTGVRGLDIDDVHAFLNTIAREYRDGDGRGSAARAEQAADTPASPAGTGDAFEQLGAEIAAVLRHAKETADRIRMEAEAEAALLRQRTVEEAQVVRSQAERAATELMRGAEARVAELREVERDLARRFAETEEIIRRTIGSLAPESSES